MDTVFPRQAEALIRALKIDYLFGLEDAGCTGFRDGGEDQHS